jgi:hypothetical protein
MGKKVEVVAEQVEVIKQVKLTSKQRLTLVEMQNHQGRHDRAFSLDYSVRADLQALGLIEERLSKTEAERKVVTAEINGLWKGVPKLVADRDHHSVDRLMGDIRRKHEELERKTWWLTDAAYEYLTKGKVTITR